MVGLAEVANERPKSSTPASLSGLRPFMRPYRLQIGLAILFLMLAAIATLLPRNPDFAPIEVPAGADFAIEGIYCGLVRQG